MHAHEANMCTHVHQNICMHIYASCVHDQGYFENISAIEAWICIKESRQAMAPVLRPIRSQNSGHRALWNSDWWGPWGHKGLMYVNGYIKMQ